MVKNVKNCGLPDLQVPPCLFWGRYGGERSWKWPECKCCKTPRAGTVMDKKHGLHSSLKRRCGKTWKTRPLAVILVCSSMLQNALPQCDHISEPPYISLLHHVSSCFIILLQFLLAQSRCPPSRNLPRQGWMQSARKQLSATCPTIRLLQGKRERTLRIIGHSLLLIEVFFIIFEWEQAWQTKEIDFCRPTGGSVS